MLGSLCFPFISFLFLGGCLVFPCCIPLLLSNKDCLRCLLETTNKWYLRCLSSCDLNLKICFFCWFEFVIGTRCLGFGLGDMDGWDGDHTIHLLPTGSFVQSLNIFCISTLDIWLLFLTFGT